MKKLILFLVLTVIPVMGFSNTLTIKKVHAGDLIEFEGGFTARLTGITVPDKTTKLGYEVYDFTKRTLEGKIVKVFTYTTNNTASGIVYNEDGHAFVQIVYGSSPKSKDWSTNFNELLLEKGYAKVNEKYLPEDLQHFKEIEQKARGANLGMWKKEKSK